MAEGFIAIDGQRLTRVTLHVPPRGAWQAECDFEGAPALGARCTLTIGSMVLSGSPAAGMGGVFGESRKVHLVAGAGGWSTQLPPRAYHNDAGVRALLVVQDAAREVGETLGATFAPERDRIGVDYVRDGAPTASQVMEDVIGEGAIWWVDFAGNTHVGTRPTAPRLLDGDYQIKSFDPRVSLLTLSVRDPSLIQIGSVVSGESLPEAQTIREYEVQVTGDGCTVLAWTGGSPTSPGRLASMWRALVARSAPSDNLTGLYRYRVVTQAVDGRLSLQAVRRNVGIPDIEPIAQWPGAPGLDAKLTPSSEVLVAFLEGDRTQPVVVGYMGKYAGGSYSPGEITIVGSLITIGGESGPPAARQGDTVQVLMPSGVFSGTINGLPASGMITFPMNTTIGTISTGSSKVRIAT